MPQGEFEVPNNSQGLTTVCWWETVDDPGNNRSLLRVQLRAIRSSSTTHGAGSVAIRLDDGDAWVDASVAVGTGWVIVSSREAWLTHNANGSRTAVVGIAAGGKPGTSWTSTGPEFRTVTLTDYVRLPSEPGTPTISAITPTGFRADWSAPSFVAAGILEYQYQIATNSAFTTGVGTASTGTNRFFNEGNRTPSTDYWVRARARNSDGWGPWSSARHVKTLSGAYVSDGTNWIPVEVFVSNGSTWQSAEVLTSNGSAWQSA